MALLPEETGIVDSEGALVRWVELPDGSASLRVWDEAAAAWVPGPIGKDWMDGVRLSDADLAARGFSPDGSPLAR